MTQLPNQPQLQPQPEPPEPNWRFRWEWIFVPLALAAALWLISGITPDRSFQDIKDALRITQEDNFRMLTALTVLLIAITIFIKILKGK